MEKNHKQIQLKNYNRRTVLNYIRKNKRATKSELAAVTGLTFMAIKKILEELMALELIREAELEKGCSGRCSAAYAINEAYRYVIGIHINRFTTRIALLNLGGTIITEESFLVDPELKEQSLFVEELVKRIRKITESEITEKENILGIGIGVPGPVNIEEGMLLTPPNMPALSYLPLKDVIEERTGFPVRLQKDTNVMALGEYWNKGAEDCCELIYIDVDMGIGSGMLVDGKLNLGYHRMAGEFGHMIIDVDGPLCNCGNRGCLEALSSGIAVLRELKHQLLTGQESHPLYQKRNALVMEDVFEMIEQKDLLTISILNRSAFYMGVAAANLINFMDPHVIVFGGIMIQHYPQYINIVSDVVDSKKVNGAKKNILTVSRLGAKAGVIGAGQIMIDGFFQETVNRVFEKNA